MKPGLDRREHAMNEKRACRVLHVSRAVFRYEAVKRPDEDALRAHIIELACNFGRIGYRMVTHILRREERLG